MLMLTVLAVTSASWHSSAFAGELPSSVLADTESVQAPATTDWLTRSTLTGDWGGARSALADKGVTFDLRHTSFYQGLVSGTGDHDFNYGGKFDALINLDTARMGLWQGGSLHSHLEYSHGNAPANLGGAIFGVNTALYWPVGTPEELVATSLYFTQQLGDNSSISIGKFNPVDLYASDPYHGGWGIDRFMNVALAAPPSGLIPVVCMGAIASIKVDPVTWTIVVLDPNDRTNDYFPGDLFADGVTIGGNATRTTKLAGRRTSYGITGFYSTAEGSDYSTIGGGVENVSNKSGAWNVNIQFKHNLQESVEQPDKAWGFFLKAGIADGNPNYVQHSFIVGIGGNALFFGRPQDTFGLGAYYYDLSDTLRDSVSGTLRLRDESAIEFFYNYAVTPWFTVGPDIQYINPASGSFDHALVAAIRAQIRF